MVRVDRTTEVSRGTGRDRRPGAAADPGKPSARPATMNGAVHPSLFPVMNRPVSASAGRAGYLGMQLQTETVTLTGMAVSQC